MNNAEKRRAQPFTNKKHSHWNHAQAREKNKRMHPNDIKKIMLQKEEQSYAHTHTNNHTNYHSGI